MPDPTVTSISQAIARLNYLDLIRAATLLGVGWLIAQALKILIGRLFRHRLSEGNIVIVQKSVVFPVLALFILSALMQMGFNLEVIIGAAGILTVALGFAAQTSASNLISGLFLLAERSFLVGDTIKVADITGKVLSIDLLSTKLLMDDHTYVRIPNELLIRSQLANLSRFTTKRVSIALVLGANTDLHKAQAILLAVAKQEGMVLDEPTPLMKINELCEQGIKVQLLVWCAAANADAVKNNLLMNIKSNLKDNNIALAGDNFVYLLKKETVDV